MCNSISLDDNFITISVQVVTNYRSIIQGSMHVYYWRASETLSGVLIRAGAVYVYICMEVRVA